MCTPTTSCELFEGKLDSITDMPPQYATGTDGLPVRDASFKTWTLDNHVGPRDLQPASTYVYTSMYNTCRRHVAMQH